MKRFSIRSLFLLVFATAILFALIRSAYDRYRYQAIVEPAWEVFPVSSRVVDVTDDNDIKIAFTPGSMELSSGASLVPATDFQGLGFTAKPAGPESLVGQYDLTCDLGEFRVSFSGDAWSALPRHLRGTRTAFETLRNALMLSPESPIANLDLWSVRQKTGYQGDGVRVRHFQTKAKSGFLVDSGESVYLEVFDKTGEYSIVIRPKSPETDCSDLVDRVELSRQQLGTGDG